MFIIEYRTLGWWYWLVTVCLLTAGVAGWTTGFSLAIGLTLVQIAHYAIRERRLSAFPIQVRVGYLVLLLVALPDALQWLYWIPTVGTWLRVLTGYCAMARVVSLLPWNRRERFSPDLLKRTLSSAPVQGGRLQGETADGRAQQHGSGA